MTSVRYHIQLRRRTTVSMDKIVSDLLSIKLKTIPGTPEAHQAISKKLDEFIAHDRDRGGELISHYINKHALLFLVDNMLSEQYWDYYWDHLLKWKNEV